VALLERIPAPLTPAAATRVLVLRNYVVYKDAWKLFITGFLEPVFYLFSIGIGVGQLIDGFTFHGHEVPYAAFVAPGMLAASAMNGAILDSTFGIFFKLRYDKVYEGVLATPMRTIDIARGELAWSLMRSAVYSAGFVLVMTAMGLVSSWWAVLAWPATWLIGFAFSGAGMALTTARHTPTTPITVQLFRMSCTWI
jgi:lipooligosaccharide transport system permease protein